MNDIKMWKGIGNTTTLLFSLLGLMEYMMVLPEVKYSEMKIVPQSDHCVGTTSRRKSVSTLGCGMCKFYDKQEDYKI